MRNQIKSVRMLKQACRAAEGNLVSVFIQHQTRHEYIDVAHSVIEGLGWDSWTVLPNADGSCRQYTSDEAFMYSESTIMDAMNAGKLFTKGEYDVACDDYQNQDQELELAQESV